VSGKHPAGTDAGRAARPGRLSMRSVRDRQANYSRDLAEIQAFDG